jgi:hypothetical protein
MKTGPLSEKLCLCSEYYKMYKLQKPGRPTPKVKCCIIIVSMIYEWKGICNITIQNSKEKEKSDENQCNVSENYIYIYTVIHNLET